MEARGPSDALVPVELGAGGLPVRSVLKVLARGSHVPVQEHARNAFFQGFVEFSCCGQHGRSTFVAGICGLASSLRTCRIDRRVVRTSRRCRRWRCNDCDRADCDHRGSSWSGRQLRSAAASLRATARLSGGARLLLWPATRLLPARILRAARIWTASVWSPGLWATCLRIGAAIQRATPRLLRSSAGKLSGQGLAGTARFQARGPGKVSPAAPRICLRCSIL